MANDNVSITLHRGEILGLLGENGAGKSTLMKILYGLYRPDSGSIFIDGEEVERGEDPGRRRAGIGMVHQHFTLIPPLTVAENIVLGAEPRKGVALDLEGAIKATEELERYGLRVDPRARVADLSVGVQQRVEILKTLYREARILVLDEPTAVLTLQETEDLFSVLKELVADGLSIILITHKLGELRGVSDHITIIRDGHVVATVRTAETDERLARLMVGRDVLLRIEKTGDEAGEPRLAAEDLVVLSNTGARAVDGVGLVVRSGEILGIAGVDGNGQTGARRRPRRGPSRRERARLPRRRGRHGSGEPTPGRARARLRARGSGEQGARAGLHALREQPPKTYDEPPNSRWGWIFPNVMRRRAAETLRAYDVRPRPGRAGAFALRW